MNQIQWGGWCNTFSLVTQTIKMYICSSLKTNFKQTETTRMWAKCNSVIFTELATHDEQLKKKNFKASISCVSLHGNMLYLLRWLYEAAGKSSWLLLSTLALRVKLIHGDVWWVIALSTRPLVLLSGLVWSFIYTPFCSGFSGQFSQLFTVNKLQSKAPISGRHIEQRKRPLVWLLALETEKKKPNPKSVQPPWTLGWPGK